MKSLTGKIVLITGSSRGIGAAIAKRMSGEGAKIIVNYASDKNEADKVVSEIVGNGGEAIALKADISKSDDVKKLFDDGIKHFGRIDVLVNNAGIMLVKPIKDTTDEDFTKQFDINVRGVFNTLREAATKLADKGTIINFSSSTTRVMIPTYGTYVATKGAVEQMTRVFSKEVAGRGITVNAVSPGPTNTELFHKGKSEEDVNRSKSLSAFNRLGEPDDIAKIVVFLASDEAKWISAQNIGINGGMA